MSNFGLVSVAVKAGAYQQAAELLKLLRANLLTEKLALRVRLRVGWNYGGEGLRVLRWTRQQHPDLFVVSSIRSGTNFIAEGWFIFDEQISFYRDGELVGVLTGLDAAEFDLYENP